MHKLLPCLLIITIASLGCAVDEPERADETGAVDPSAESHDYVAQPLELAAATWPDDLARAEFYPHDEALVIVAVNHDGDPIARVSMHEHAPGIVHVETEYADGKSWATVDVLNNALVQHNTKALTELEVAARVEAIADTIKVSPPEGPWLDCVLGILDAVISCIPGVGVLTVCPSKIRDAFCTCANAAKKKKKKACD